MNIKTTAAVVLALAAASPASAATRRLVLFGGGEYSAGGIERLAQWSGGRSGRVLFIPWASTEPEDYYKEFKDALSSGTSPTLDLAPAAVDVSTGRALFLSQLSSATAVFFCGGDQNRIVRVLQKDPDLRAALQTRYMSGIPFSGTSAGTAVMSELMLTGEGDVTALDGKKVGTDRGLGLLPGVILDQHFLVRQRENRLFGAVLAHPELLGVGIDADSVLAVTDELHAEVVGPAQTMVVKAEGPGRLGVALFTLGQTFEMTAPKPR